MLSIGPVATALGSDFVANRMLSIRPVATALGSDFVANRVDSVGPVATALGSDFVANRRVECGLGGNSRPFRYSIQPGLQRAIKAARDSRRFRASTASELRG